MPKQDKTLFKPELVFFDMECEDRWDFFKQLQAKLDPMGYLQSNWYEGITTREKTYPTGLRCPSIEVAIPHADPEYIKTPYIAVVVPKKPIVFEHMAGVDDPVDAQLIMNLGVVRDGGQVEVLQTLMNIFASDEKVADIMAQTTPEGMVDAITKYFD